MACDSTVDKRPPHRAFSLPFGFVQSPIVASVVLAQSALGGAIRRLSRDGMTITVYVDDITLSGPNEHRVGEAIAALETAAALSVITFNAHQTPRTEERRVGKAGFSTCISRGLLSN